MVLCFKFISHVVNLVQTFYRFSVRIEVIFYLLSFFVDFLCLYQMEGIAVNVKSARNKTTF